jgi:hypothetical protein
MQEDLAKVAYGLGEIVAVHTDDPSPIGERQNTAYVNVASTSRVDL